MNLVAKVLMNWLRVGTLEDIANSQKARESRMLSPCLGSFTSTTTSWGLKAQGSRMHSLFALANGDNASLWQ